METKYYDGTKLLSMMDINGEKPELYLCTSNRSAGKTTYFGRYCINRYLKYKEKFCLVYRFSYECDNCDEKFFKDLNRLFFPGSSMKSERRASGAYHQLYFDGEPCGYAIALNMADQLKKYSHLLSDVVRMLFDEFQSESNHYCPNEIQKFISVHTSIARGGGKLVRYVPVIMLSNTVSILNPYFAELGIAERLNNETKFLRGEGFVLEQGYVESASIAQRESPFNRAFSNNKYVAYSSQNVYLNDNTAFIEKPEGKSRYVCTLIYNDVNYAIREYYEEGILYCDTSPDMSHFLKISVTTSDHRINYVMLKKNDYIISNFRFYFERGCFRFKNMICKEAVLKALSYTERKQ